MFYHLTESIIALVGAILLLFIWSNIRQRFYKRLEESENQKRVDKGLLYLSFAFLVWTVKSIVAIYLASADVVLGQAIAVFFSLANSLFFVLALFHFDHAPNFLYQNKKNVKRIIAIFVLISIVSFGLFYQFDKDSVTGFQISSFPDLLISIILTYLLIYSFYKTFIERQLQFVAYFSVVALILMFLAQLPELIPTIDSNAIYVDLIRVISKSTLISLCLVLATSWVIELAETPTPSEMSVKFIDWQLIELNIPSKGIHRQKIDFGTKATQFRNLLKFAIRRKYAPVDERSIEIIKDGEIQGQVYLTRILEDINAKLENSKADRKDIFTFIGLGKYRVRFLSEHINIEETLLHEFVGEKGNEKYGKFIESN